MAAKLDKKMIAICSAAIGIVYAAGYVVTQPVAAQSDGPAAAPAVLASAPSAAAPSPAVTSSKPAPASKYKDGTYTGSGSNRIGSVEVAVTIKNDKITDVAITNCTTHYSQSRIDALLPREVLTRQSSQVDVVSGATKSTQDFRTAVDQALAQAQTQARSTN